ncbi:MAG: hypothetical protein NC411_04350 [Bacteroides sp.]|nr:hypothetical protein [Bacteroides sp.]
MIEKYKLSTRLFFTALWILLTYGFVTEEFIPVLSPYRSYVFPLCDIIFLILGLVTLRSKRDIIITISFVLIAGISCKLNRIGIVTAFNGGREFFGLIFVVPFIRYYLESKYRERFITSFDKQLFIFLILQAVCITWQFLRYGANDHGGGSMGNGYSGIVSTLIYITSFYLLSQKWTYGNYWGNIAKYKIYFILLYPTFLNETKISFIYIVLYFLLLLPIELKTVFKIFASIPFILIALISLGFVYLAATGQSSDSVFSQTAMDEYLTGNVEDDIVELALAVQDDIYDPEDMGMLEIPRFLKLALIPEAMIDSDGGVMFGAGLGQLKGGTVVEKTPYAERWSWLLSGTNHGALIIFIQLGIMGFIWFVYDIVTVLVPHSNNILGKNIKLYVSFIILLMMFYNDALRFFPFWAIIFYIVMRDNIRTLEIKDGI